MGAVKKVKLRKRRSAAKAKTVPQSVGEYLARLPEPAGAVLAKMRAAIRSAVPADATETISYGIPAFRNEKAVLVWYAAFADHCSLFPTASVIQAFKKELKAYSTSKGTIHFPLDKPFPVGLIQRLVKARVARVKSK